MSKDGSKCTKIKRRHELLSTAAAAPTLDAYIPLPNSTGELLFGVPVATTESTLLNEYARYDLWDLTYQKRKREGYFSNFRGAFTSNIGRVLADFVLHP